MQLLKPVYNKMYLDVSEILFLKKMYLDLIYKNVPDFVCNSFTEWMILE